MKMKNEIAPGNPEILIGKREYKCTCYCMNRPEVQIFTHSE